MIDEVLKEDEVFIGIPVEALSLAVAALIKIAIEIFLRHDIFVVGRVMSEAVIDPGLEFPMSLLECFQIIWIYSPLSFPSCRPPIRPGTMITFAMEYFEQV